MTRNTEFYADASKGFPLPDDWSDCRLPAPKCNPIFIHAWIVKIALKWLCGWCPHLTHNNSVVKCCSKSSMVYFSVWLSAGTQPLMERGFEERYYWGLFRKQKKQKTAGVKQKAEAVGHENKNKKNLRVQKALFKILLVQQGPSLCIVMKTNTSRFC